jgi:hypothetical protein
MRAKSGTVRFIHGTHSLKKKPNLVIKWKGQKAVRNHKVLPCKLLFEAV